VSAPSPSPAAPLLAELYGRGGTVDFGITLAEFAEILTAIGAKYLAPDASERECEQFYRGLRVEELALARACAAGNERAWEEFLTRYREKLYSAAYGITKDESRGRELADSLYADLYAGSSTRPGERSSERKSKLASYTGRGSLEGWLRTVLAQEYVNRYRTQRRLVSLEEQAEAGVQFASGESDPTPPPDPRLEAAVEEALGTLSAEERFVLAAYHLDGRTLAEIGRTLGLHESTISRKLEKATRTTRSRIVEALQQRGMSRAQAEEALAADVRDVTVDLRRALDSAQETGRRAFCIEDESSDPAPGKSHD
jgi:RNA polymerase sigma-70 factor (ECF subfamily)